MSNYRDPDLRLLDDCGCCEGIDVQVPIQVNNRPGLASIAYRIGTQSQFKQSLLARLATLPYPALKQLTTRDTNDFAIALLDAWAILADILTFYQERIANESYLQTATERLSLIHLSRLLGYKPRPGVAASTHIAFMLEDTPSAPQQVTIEAGTKVQSLPGPEEDAQIFETVEAIEARPEWNVLKPRTTQAPRFALGTVDVYLQGTTTQLKPGDPLLLIGSERQRDVHSEQWEFRRIKRISVNLTTNQTHIELDQGLGSITPLSEPASRPQIYALRQRAALFGHNAPDHRLLPSEVTNKFLAELLPTPSTAEDWNFTLSASAVDLDTVYPSLVPDSWAVLVKPSYAELYRVTSIRESARKNYTLSARTTQLTLEGEHLNYFDQRDLRSTVVFAQSEELAIADPPYNHSLTLDAGVELKLNSGTLTPVTGDVIEIDHYFPNLERGRTLIISGKLVRVQAKSQVRLTTDTGHLSALVAPNALLQVLSAPQVMNRKQIRWHLQTGDGVTGYAVVSPNAFMLISALEADALVSEPITLKRVTGNPSQLNLEQPLRHWYDRATVVLQGNVSFATHGETKEDVLGSGDAAQAFQTFVLRHSPLTHISAPTGTGAESTLELRVNDIRWQEVPALFGAGNQRVFTAFLNQDGQTVIQFGDGQTLGARLPSGIESLRGRYRQGLGTSGNVKAGQLSLLLKRPLGVKSCTNPIAARGGTDPPDQSSLRQDLPTTVLTLGRIVSRQDYADFARTFAGIAKALATELGTARRAIAVTVAGTAGQPVDSCSALHQNLVQAMRRSGDPLVTVRVMSYQPVYFRLAATLTINPNYLPGKVLEQVRQALKQAFSFAARQLGQGVSRSEVIAIMQRVEGIVAVDLDQLYRQDQEMGIQPLLKAALPRPTLTIDSVTAAELLLLDPSSLEAVEVQR